VVVVVGVGNLLEVADDPKVDVGWAGLDTVPDIEVIGDEGTVLGGEEEEEDDDWTALAEVLAFGILTFGAGISAGAAGGTGIDLAAGTSLVWIGGAWSRMNSALESPPVTVYQLNRNSGTVSGSPVRSQ
jgi:hypothetical protein